MSLGVHSARAVLLAGLLPVAILGIHPIRAMESPYFVTYSHHMEEPSELEISLSATWGIPRSGQQAFLAPYLELEYGATTWWTSSLYLEGQSTRGDSTIFTGWRFENRFRPLTGERSVNPVLYIEYENINEASKIQKEIVGNAPSFDETNDELRQVQAHELEAKLILSGDVGPWNLAGNIIAEKNLSESEGLEFGYAAAFSRPFVSGVAPQRCRLCPENFIAGLELYGGLGSTHGFGLHDTAQYLAPVISWQFRNDAALRFSTAIGLTDGSYPVLLRFGFVYEVDGFGRAVARLFGARP